ncbi:MAG: 1-acyl-sn-glycerol-3-phosphate acyltransferase [Rhizobiales bacterium]|nr:1-acyl-sn-glycerol-3-phosphate acyltransferase [Hyphomicrobiales bacterium]
MIETLVAAAVRLFARFVTAVRAEWRGFPPDDTPRVYFANHNSHGDFVLVWTVLPDPVRNRTRPVAAAEYWRKDKLRRFFGERVFNAVLVEREAEKRVQDPIGQMAEALDQGSSLILFPEGTRNLTELPLLPFKSGIYRLALARAGLEMVPVWIANLNRVMPKGELIPVPLICTVAFGTPLRLRAGEEKTAFLERARAALLRLKSEGAASP